LVVLEPTPPLQSLCTQVDKAKTYGQSSGDSQDYGYGSQGTDRQYGHAYGSGVKPAAVVSRMFG